MSGKASDKIVKAFLENNYGFFSGWLGVDVVGPEPLTLEKLIELVDGSEEVQAHRVTYTEYLREHPELVTSPNHMKHTKEILGHFSGTPEVKRAFGSRHMAKTFLSQQAA